MVNYDSKLLKLMAIFSILFFVISVFIFIFIYSSLNINQEDKNNLVLQRTNVISIEDNIKSLEEQKSYLQKTYDQRTNDYNNLIVNKKTQSSNTDSSVNQLANVKSDISSAQNKITQLNRQIADLKAVLGQ